jgi:hypothetical protein
VVVVLHALLVFQHMGERRRAGGMRQAALHGETIQGQAEQQEEVDEPAQRRSL